MLFRTAQTMTTYEVKYGRKELSLGQAMGRLLSNLEKTVDFIQATKLQI